jgi:glutamate dehydrogenase
MAGTGMTRPELAVLLSWSKIALNKDLLASTVPDDSACEGLLLEYFPPPLRDKLPAEIKGHPLRREIVATRITNSMINRGGPAAAVRLADETGCTMADIAYAFMAARAIFGLPEVWAAIDRLDGKISGALQLELYAETQELLIDQTAGLLRQRAGPTLADLIATYRPGIESLAAILDRVTTSDQQTRMAEVAKRLRDGGVPAELAQRIAGFEAQRLAPAISDLARSTDRSFEDAARVAFSAADYFRLGELEARAGALKVADYYDRLAIDGALASLRAAIWAIASRVLRDQRGHVPDLAEWTRTQAAELARAKALLDEIVATPDITVSRLTVAASRVRELAGT